MNGSRPRQQAVYGDNPREDVAPFIPANATSVLEVGCGRGGFGITLRRRLGDDVTIVGVEAMPSEAAVAREAHGFDEVLTGYFPEILAGRNDRFDVIVFNDVLEHILEPWDVLDQAHERLTPKGCVVAAIPSIQYAPVVMGLLRGRWDYSDTGTLDRTHVRFFTKSSMVMMFEKAGYRVEQCTRVVPI
ncbi:MAG: class I SAM-dependent methyltransferase [Actinobacteria bacterium]|nr:class I SAM-dependent methyltransferase [Actinomycetota bacterium]